MDTYCSWPKDKVPVIICYTASKPPGEVMKGHINTWLWHAEGQLYNHGRVTSERSRSGNPPLLEITMEITGVGLLPQKYVLGLEWQVLRKAHLIGKVTISFLHLLSLSQPELHSDLCGKGYCSWVRAIHLVFFIKMTNSLKMKNIMNQITKRKN